MLFDIEYKLCWHVQENCLPASTQMLIIVSGEKTQH